MADTQVPPAPEDSISWQRERARQPGNTGGQGGGASQPPLSQATELSFWQLHPAFTLFPRFCKTPSAGVLYLGRDSPRRLQQYLFQAKISRPLPNRTTRMERLSKLQTSDWHRVAQVVLPSQQFPVQ